MKHEDFERPPCPCPPCVQAGVSGRTQIRDHATGRWLHGYDLARWYAAREAFWAGCREAVGRMTMPVGREREPGEEG